MLNDIKYNIDKIEDQTGIVLAKLGDVKLLNPTITCIILYCKFCSIPKMETDQEIDELWWRIIECRLNNLPIYSSDAGNAHPCEPYYDDLVRYKGIYINDMLYLASQQWLNVVRPLFTRSSRDISRAEKLIKPNATLFKMRDDSTLLYIQDQMDIKHGNMPGQNQSIPPHQNPNQNNQHQQNKNTTDDKPPVDADGIEFPPEIVAAHIEIVTKRAIEKRKKGIVLNEEEQKYLKEWDAEQLLKPAATPEPAQNTVKPLENIQKPSPEKAKQIPKKPILAKPAKKIANIGKKQAKKPGKK